MNEPTKQQIDIVALTIAAGIEDNSSRPYHDLDPRQLDRAIIDGELDLLELARYLIKGGPKSEEGDDQSRDT